ncbi:MAG TPA: dCTP deaminase [Allocoleopsis sp.]
MILNDLEIKELSTKYGMIEPYSSELIRLLDNAQHDVSKAISWGQSSFGYDIRLAYEPVKIFRHIPGVITDPKDFNPILLEEVASSGYNAAERSYRNYHAIHQNQVHIYHNNVIEKHDNIDAEENYFILPAHSYALGVSVEKFTIPKNIIGICLGKSTYARSGILVNVTPLESGWQGYLTIEISNISPSPCRIYLNEGIAQLLFLQGNIPKISYNDRKGKYQNQPQTVVLPTG